MIQRASSMDLNALTDEAMKRITTLEDASAQKMSEVLLYKDALKAMEENMTLQLTSSSLANYSKVMLIDNTIDGKYERFGNFIHPVPTDDIPRNLLNVNGRSGVVFRDNVTCTINGKNAPEFKQALMHEQHDEKQMYFKKFDTNSIEIVVDINDENYIMLMDVGAIEFAPTIGGNFVIERITVEDAYVNEATVIESSLANAGPVRYFLGEKVSMSRITFNIKLLQKGSDGRYAFGVNHLYFLDYNTDTRSNAVVKFIYNDYIDTISEKVYVETSSERVETTLSELGAKVYLNYQDGVFDYQVETTINEDKHHLSVNTKELYISLPVPESIISIQFDQIISK